MNFETENERFQDGGALIYHFTDEILVVCPRCGGQACVLEVKEFVRKKLRFQIAPHKLVCPNCGHNDYWKKHTIVTGGTVDCYFRQPLWLQTECCQNILWAYNERHLLFLESYIGARLRQREPHVNRSVASRLPHWMINGKNRQEVLKGIGRLKVRLGEKYGSV